MKTKPRVLVVDDDGSMLGAFERILLGFDVTTSSSLGQARRRLAETRFDAVVCEIKLRDGSGFDLFAELRATAPEQAARFVLMSTAADDPAVRARLERTGAPYLCKPFPVPLFLDMVVCLSEGRQPRRTSSARRLWVSQFSSI
jgi:DNA-binding response OmpR family regulator